MGGCTTHSPSFAILLWWLVVVVGRNAQFQVLSWQSPALSSGVWNQIKPAYPCHRYRFFRGTKVCTLTHTPGKPVAKPVTFPTDMHIFVKTTAEQLWFGSVCRSLSTQSEQWWLGSACRSSLRLSKQHRHAHLCQDSQNNSDTVRDKTVPMIFVYEKIVK